MGFCHIPIVCHYRRYKRRRCNSHWHLNCFALGWKINTAGIWADEVCVWQRGTFFKGKKMWCRCQKIPACSKISYGGHISLSSSDFDTFLQREKERESDGRPDKKDSYVRREIVLNSRLESWSDTASCAGLTSVVRLNNKKRDCVSHTR